MTDFTKQYTDLIVKQYWEKVRAFGEINFKAENFEIIRDFFTDITEDFDVDTATGNTLDIIGKIVGLERNQPEFDDDEFYRFFIKLQISVNTANAFMVSSTKNGTGIQDSVFLAFSGLAYVTDKKNMSIDLYIDDSVPLSTVSLIINLNLIPKPQGVRIGNIVQVGQGPFFGFRNNSSSKGFASKFDPAYEGGKLADKVIV